MAKDDKNKEETVSVEMTAEQRDEVVKYLADKKKAAEPKEPETLLDIDLRFEHKRTNVAGGTKSYGPGMARRVPEGIASSLLVADEAAFQSRLKEMTDNGGMVEILGRGQVRPVKSAV